MKNVRQVILFCDVHGFARSARGLGDRMPAFVQAFYETAGEAIVRGGGTILKYIGDAILAVFPAGREREAVEVALAMRRAFAGLVDRWKVDPPCELGAAIHAGEVTRGAFGHSSLRTDDIMGEEVSIASVLTGHRGVAISAPVNDAVAGSFPTEPLPDLTVKWRGEPLRAWRVVET